MLRPHHLRFSFPPTQPLVILSQLCCYPSRTKGNLDRTMRISSPPGMGISMTDAAIPFMLPHRSIGCILFFFSSLTVNVSTDRMWCLRPGGSWLERSPRFTVLIQINIYDLRKVLIGLRSGDFITLPFLLLSRTFATSCFSDYMLSSFASLVFHMICLPHLSQYPSALNRNESKTSYHGTRRHQQESI